MDEGSDSQQDDCWRGFWEIVGAEAYRLWREDQASQKPDRQEAA